MDKKIKVLVIDDEALARKRLIRFLKTEPDVEIVGACAAGQEAVGAIRRTKPDVLFLDVQMPEVNGFDVLSTLNGTYQTRVVFVTAYDEYAVRAFEVGALDYLLKPFGIERFSRAFARVRADLARDRDDYSSRLSAYLEAASRRPEGLDEPPPSAPVRHLDRLMVKAGGRVFFLRVAEIDWIESADNYVRLHVGKEIHLIRQTLAALEANLDPRLFVRIHRRTIVNLDRVEEIHPGVGREHVVVLKGGAELRLSPRYRQRLEAGTRPTS